jgi:hypothetical protein
MHKSFVTIVLHNKGNRWAQKGKMSTYLLSVHGEESDCEKVFKRFGSWNSKLPGLKVGNLTWQWKSWGSIVECFPLWCWAFLFAMLNGWCHIDIFSHLLLASFQCFTCWVWLHWITLRWERDTKRERLRERKTSKEKHYEKKRTW